MEMTTFCFGTSSRPISGAWIILTFIYLSLLQLVGVVLAFRTRKIKIKALKDSKYIVAAMYISAIALITIAISTFVVGALPNVIELLFSGSLMVSSTVFLSMVFVPKVRMYYAHINALHYILLLVTILIIHDVVNHVTSCVRW